MRLGHTKLAVALTLALIVGTSASAQNKPAKPLEVRGYTDAPNATRLVAGDPVGGPIISELYVREGQQVKKDQVIAKLSNSTQAEGAVQISQAELARERVKLSQMSGHRVAEITSQEAIVNSAILKVRLKALEIDRSSLPLNMRKLELEIAQAELVREQNNLRWLRDVYDFDRKMIELDVARWSIEHEKAAATRDLSVVRSPIDGAVTQVFARAGTRVPADGIVNIVNSRDIRVFAEVPEFELERVTLKQGVEVTFRGHTEVHRGVVVRIGTMSKRTNRRHPDAGSVSDVPVVQVEIVFDDMAKVEPVLGREVIIIFR